MIYIFIAAAVLAADILTKLIAELRLSAVGSIPVIENVFHLTYVENRGIAFGLFSGGRTVFIVISIVILIVLAAVVFKTPKPLRTVWLKTGVALIASGAIGNLIDRIAKSYVVDFLDFRFINFPVFNIADIAVCVGAAMLIIHFLTAESKAEEKLNSEENAEEQESE